MQEIQQTMKEVNMMEVILPNSQQVSITITIKCPLMI